MRKWGTAFLAAVAVAFAGGCAGTGPGQSAATAPSPVMKVLPSFIGKGLATAKSDAQAAGFSNVSTHDASGRGRMQILDRDWKVCSQAPPAGSNVSTATTVGLGVVKLAEACPATDQGTASPSPASEGNPMPDLIGKSLNVAIASLPSSTSITPRDVSGQHRVIIIASNWKVCSQQPGPGATFSGQPVSFGVVKFGESCP
jgi:hypothetical protein